MVIAERFRSYELSAPGRGCEVRQLTEQDRDCTEKQRGAKESDRVSSTNDNVRGVRRLWSKLIESRATKVVSTLAFRGFGAGLAALLTMSVTRYLNISAAAEFLLIFNVTTVAAVCFRWGLDDLIVRRVATCDAPKAPSEISYLMKLAHRRVVIWAVLSALAIAAFGLTRLTHTTGVNVRELATAVIISALIALTACAGRVQQGLGRTNFAAFILNILIPGLLLLGLLVLVSLCDTVSSTQLQVAYLAISLLAYLGTVWVSSLSRPYRKRSATERSAERRQAKTDRKAALRLGGVVLSQVALTWVALLVVPVAYGDQLFTSFMVVYKVALLINLVQIALNFTFASRLATLFNTGEFRELQRLTRIMVVSVAASCAFTAGVIFLARGFFYTFADIASLDRVLAVLVVSQTFYAISAVYALVLGMCYEEAFLLKVQGGIVTAGVTLFVALSFTAPLEVAAGAFAVTYLALVIVLRYQGLRVVRGVSSAPAQMPQV